ncbi:MAG: hypothetical protein HY645_06280 [Acidobacteria bacterium]|nr:hypothetical protein [Acidobacteriota bacterium]
MTIRDHYREKRERYEFQMGAARGKLAMALDVLNDAIALVGSHAIYCRNSGSPEKPKMDIQIIMEELHESKHLIAGALQELNQGRKG